jgi:hypothetical protein
MSKKMFTRIALAVLLCTAFNLNAQILINEIDSDTPGTDTLEFVELSSTVPNFSLNGYVLVFYNGSTDVSYLAVDLTGFSTDVNGFFTVGNVALVPPAGIVVPNNTIQNGADAVALYLDSAANFPNGTAVTLTNLIDAVVYSTADPADPGLLVLTPGMPQVDEAANGLGDTQSIQRCPDGSGGPLNTTTFVATTPTPGASNSGGCPTYTLMASQDIPNCGPIIVQVTGAAPFGRIYNLVSLACSNGSGPLFGVGMDAFSQVFLPVGTAPFHVLADASGNYNFSLPSMCLGAPGSVEVVSIEVGGFGAGTVILNVSSSSGCVPIAL